MPRYTFRATRDSSRPTRLRPVRPGFSVSELIQSDMLWINSETLKLDDNIKTLANQAGFHYVDAYNLMNTHELCTQ